MKKNMGTADRIIRTIVALVIVFLFIQKQITGIVGYVLIAFAAVFLVTSLFGTCPLYSLFGLSTCGKKQTIKIN
ncbi:MAG: DUF2892 domain-containing protein [Chitinophagaceae bacterium]